MLALVLLGCWRAPEPPPVPVPVVEVLDCAEVECPWDEPTIGMSIPNTDCPPQCCLGVLNSQRPKEDLLRLLGEHGEARCSLGPEDYQVEALPPEWRRGEPAPEHEWSASLSRSRPCAPSIEALDLTFEVRDDHLSQASQEALHAWLSEHVQPQRAALRLPVKLGMSTYGMGRLGREDFLARLAAHLGAHTVSSDDWSAELWIPAPDTTVSVEEFESCVPEGLVGELLVPVATQHWTVAPQASYQDGVLLVGVERRSDGGPWTTRPLAPY